MFQLFGGFEAQKSGQFQLNWDSWQVWKYFKEKLDMDHY